MGFSTFGVPHLLCLLGEAKIRACKAAWYAKWFVHRALRPEEYGGLVQMVATGKANYRLHADILNSAALAATVSSNNGTYLLPQAFPEGSPQHPSFPQGHATMAGACATILKAAFDGSIPLNTLGDRRIVTASADGLSLADYTGSDANQITVNGEINKLASNIGQAREQHHDLVRRFQRRVSAPTSPQGARKLARVEVDRSFGVDRVQMQMVEFRGRQHLGASLQRIWSTMRRTR
jgi:hypothetical protein